MTPADLIRAHRFHFDSEAELQDGIAAVFTSAGVDFQRERSLNAADRPDFQVGTLGIEVKIGGSTSALIRQLHRYAQCDEIEALLVVTSRMRLAALPDSISGKPIEVVSLSERML